MRRFAVCFSSLGILAASIVSGCSSDNPTTSGDSGTDTSTTMMDSSTAADAPAESSVVDARKEAAACVPFDANVATVPAGAQWACIQAACGTQLTACAADCVCNDAILTALVCAAAPGANQTSCFFAALASGSPAVGAVGVCLQMKSGACTPEGGTTDAATDGGAEGGGGNDGAVDGGAEGGGTEGGAESGVDGGTDSAATDAPTG